MQNNENQYTIYIRSTKESIPVNKEEFDAYYHDINIYRIRQQRHGRCVCPASKRLTCDMDCLTCPFQRMGDMRSLDYTETDDEGNETAWVDEIPDDSPLLEGIIIEASEMKALYARLTDLMPEAIKIGELRLEGLTEDAIGERIDTITDDSEYRRQLEDLNNGCGEVQTLIRSLLMTYSRQDTADDIHEKLKEYEDRLDTMARLKQELDLKIAACAAKRVQITGFLNELMKHDAPLAKFDPLVWQAVINYATVNRDCTITFTFRDGTEKTVPIKNGVRPYTKRNKPQEVDGNDG